MRRIGLGSCVMIVSTVWVLGCGGSSEIQFPSTASSGTGGASTGSQGGSGPGGGGQGGVSQGGGSQGGASQSGTGGASQSGTGGGATEQNCVDGLDDDNDGLADCEDPDCASGFTCAPAAPPQWAGIGWLDSSLSPCPAGLADQTDLYDVADLDAPPPSCSCACGAAVGVSCGTHMRCASSQAECAAQGPMNGQSTTCGNNIPNTNFPAFCRADPIGASGGACAVSTVGAPPPVMWAPANQTCATDKGGACADAAAVCIPKLSGGVGPCITRTGDHACPAPYTDKTLSYDGQVMDTRACSNGSCSCTAPMGSTCDCGALGCAVELDSDGACANMSASVPANAMCVPVQNKPGSAKVVGAAAVPGACAAGGASQPTGGVVPTGSVTVCCMP